MLDLSRARHIPLFVWFFKIYIHWNLKIKFNRLSVVYKNLTIDNPTSLLVVANHFTWWDGFLIHWLNEMCWGKKFHVMMLESQLKKFKILNKAGAYAINKDSREVLTTLDYTVKILSNPNHLVLMFPQGQITSMHVKHIHFKKGLERIVHKIKDSGTLVFVVVLVDYYSTKKPNLFFYVKDVKQSYQYSSEELEQQYNEFYIECIEMQRNLNPL